jgi:hypothetical protein
MDANVLFPSLAALAGLYRSITSEMDRSLDTFRTLIPTTQSEFSSESLNLVFFDFSAKLILPPFHSQGTEYYLVTPSINDALITYLPSTNVLTNLRLNSFNIYAVNPANSNWHYLGASVSIGGPNLEYPRSLALFTGTKGKFAVPMPLH